MLGTARCVIRTAKHTVALIAIRGGLRKSFLFGLDHRHMDIKLLCALQELVLSRALVLEAATNVLVDYKSRRSYDGSMQIEIPYSDLPGNGCASQCMPV